MALDKTAILDRANQLLAEHLDYKTWMKFTSVEILQTALLFETASKDGKGGIGVLQDSQQQAYRDTAQIMSKEAGF